MIHLMEIAVKKESGYGSKNMLQVEIMLIWEDGGLEIM